MSTAYRLARADTHTPVGYWMQLPVRELLQWVDVIAKVQEQDKKKG